MAVKSPYHAHPIDVFLRNIIFLHSPYKGTLKEFDGADGAESKNSAEQRIGCHHGFHRNLFPAHNQEIADYTANYQTNRDEPECAYQQEQNRLNCSADSKYPLLWYLGQ